jgi:hypothetical protein
VLAVPIGTVAVQGQQRSQEQSAGCRAAFARGGPQLGRGHAQVGGIHASRQFVVGDDPLQLCCVEAGVGQGCAGAG